MAFSGVTVRNALRYRCNVRGVYLVLKSDGAARAMGLV